MRAALCVLRLYSETLVNAVILDKVGGFLVAVRAAGGVEGYTATSSSNFQHTDYFLNLTRRKLPSMNVLAGQVAD